ncbi:MAG: glutamate synthase-related protein, partial [Nitrososphaerales archaeon]
GLARARSAELNTLDNAQEERRGLLTALRARIEEEGSEIDRLSAQEQDLARLIAELTNILSDYPISSEEPFSDLKGRLTWPVAGNLLPSALGRALILEGAELSSKSKSLPCAVTVSLQEGLDSAQDLRRFREIHLPIFLRVPSSEEAISWLDNIPQTGISGILVDWDIPSESRIDIGISIAEIDKILRHRMWDGEPQRSQLDLLASGSRIRGAGDIFKLIALGADAVGISESVLISIGYTAEKMDRFDFDVGLERLENLVLGLQKEVKLLAGAAGVSSVHKSLTGNRELIRSIDLDPIVRRRLDVKAGGGL